jgi:hypothetical protein
MLLPSVSIYSTSKGYNFILYIFFTHQKVSKMFFSCFNMIHDADFFPHVSLILATQVSLYLLFQVSKLIFLHVPGPQHSSNIFNMTPPSLPSLAPDCFYLVCKVSIPSYFSVWYSILLIICDIGGDGLCSAP